MMPDPLSVRVFTVEEANSLIPELAMRLQNLQDLQTTLLQKEASIDALELLYGKTSHQVQDELESYQALVRQVSAGVAGVQEMGAMLKDIETGLIDFYARRDGGLVYLCWKLGEQEILYWHDIEGGFSSRQPIHTF